MKTVEEYIRWELGIERLMDRPVTAPLSVAAFVLAHGRQMPWAPRPPGVRAGSAWRGCYANAGKRALRDHRLTYCEGIGWTPGMGCPHAWLLDESGRVLDPTWAAADAQYWGVAIRTDYLRKFVRQHSSGSYSPYMQLGRYWDKYPVERGRVDLAEMLVSSAVTGGALRL